MDVNAKINKKLEESSKRHDEYMKMVHEEERAIVSNLVSDIMNLLEKDNFEIRSKYTDTNVIRVNSTYKIKHYRFEYDMKNIEYYIKEALNVEDKLNNSVKYIWITLLNDNTFKIDLDILKKGKEHRIGQY